MSGFVLVNSRVKSASAMVDGSTRRNSGARLRTWLKSGSGRNSRTSVGVKTARSVVMRGMGAELDYWTIGPPDNRITGPQDHRTAGLRDHRTTGHRAKNRAAKRKFRSGLELIGPFVPWSGSPVVRLSCGLLDGRKAFENFSGGGRWGEFHRSNPGRQKHLFIN